MTAFDETGEPLTVFNKTEPAFTDLMIDLETLGTLPTAPILSIGAVLFNSADPHCSTLAKFHRHVDLQSELRSGAVPDASTILWWMGQSAEAREAIIEGQGNVASSGRQPLADVLDGLNRFVRAYLGAPHNLLVWSNPSGFDLPMIRTRGVATHSPEPAWNHWNERCLRTLAKDYPNAVRPSPELAHDALSDAVAQAHWLCNIRTQARMIRSR